MITKQEVDIDGDKIKLRNTFDIAAAKEAAHESTQEGDSRKATYKCMGYIPPEMWQYDPWLIQARKAQIAGDRQEYADLLRRFFDVHKALRVTHKKHYFNGVKL